MAAVLYERDRRAMVKKKTVLEIYEEKREWVRKLNLTSDLFSGKVFEDVDACQELCGLLLRDLDSTAKRQNTVCHTQS